jgi:hypothetical protein
MHMGAWYPEVVKTFQNFLSIIEETMIQQTEDNNNAIKGQVGNKNTEGFEMLGHVVTSPRSRKFMPEIEQIFTSKSWMPKNPPMVMRLRAKTEFEK